MSESVNVILQVVLIPIRTMIWFYFNQTEENSPKKEGEVKSKKELFKLCKTELTVQAANSALNKFYNWINAKVNEFNLEKQVSIMW